MNKKATLLIIILIAPLSGMIIDMIAPSLPIISHALATKALYSKWLITACLIGFGLGQLVFGNLSDQIGRKKPLIFGLSLFSFSCFIAAFSQHIGPLLILRAIQGFGASAASVCAKAIIGDVFSGKERMRAVSRYNAAWGIGAIAAPIIGSYLQHWFNWQANFLALCIVGIALLLCCLFFQETHTNAKKTAIKTTLNTYKQILSAPTFLAAGISTGLGYALLLLFSITAPFIIQHAMHYSVITFGHIALLMAISSVIGSLGADAALKHMSGVRLSWLSLSLLLITSITFVILAHFFDMELWVLVIPIMIMIFSEPLFYANNFAIAMSQFESQRGSASAALGLLLSVSSTTVSIVVSLISLTTLVPTALSYTVIAIILFGLFLYLPKAH